MHWTGIANGSLAAMMLTSMALDLEIFCLFFIKFTNLLKLGASSVQLKYEPPLAVNRLRPL